MPIVGYSRASSFSPLQVGWTHAYWAEGPEFAALGLSNGAAVATWPDEVIVAASEASSHREGDSDSGENPETRL